MSCPKCGGYTLFNDYDDDPEQIIAISKGTSYASKGLWVYRRSHCEDCDWEGITREWYQGKGESEDYQDDVELPEEDIVFIKEE